MTEGPSGPDSGAPRTFASLGIYNFRIYLAGVQISFTGLWMLRVALIWLVLRLSDSGLVLGVVTALNYVPTIIVGSWAGVLADRYPKRIVLLLTSSSMGLVALVLGLLTVTDRIELWHVYVLVLVFGCLQSIDMPTRLSFVSEMVPAELLANAVAINSTGVNAARLIGPAIAGVLISLVGTGPVMLVYSASVLGIMSALLLMRTGELQTPERLAAGRGNFAAGVRYVWNHQTLRPAFLLVIVLGAFALAQETVLPLIVKGQFDAGADAYGLTTLLLASGTFGGALLATRRSRPSLRLLLWATTACGAAWLVTSAAPSLPWMIASMPLLGVAQLTAVTAANSIVQLSAEPGVRGRVLALYLTALLGGTPIGAPIAGWIAEVASPRAAAAAVGVLTIAGAGLAAALHARRGRAAPHDSIVDLAQHGTGVAKPSGDAEDQACVGAPERWER